MKAPCLECQHRNDNKNTPVCTRCDLRVAYLRSTEAETIVRVVKMEKQELPETFGAMRKAISHEQIPPETKRCNKCGRTLPLESFVKNKECAFGRSGECRDCRNQRKGKKINHKPVAAHIPVEAHSHAPLPAPDDQVTVDFSARPDLLLKIGEMADRDFRTMQDKYGDVPVVLWDLDSSRYFSLAPENIEAQRMQDGSIRVSVGPNSYSDEKVDEPSERPLR